MNDVINKIIKTKIKYLYKKDLYKLYVKNELIELHLDFQ